MASSSLGDRKQVQDARFDSHLTGVKKESFYWRTKTIAHNKAFPIKYHYYMAESVFAMRLVNLRSVTCYTDQTFSRKC